MKIERINSYSDPRFSQNALNQHGCFLVDGVPCEIEITAGTKAMIRGGIKEAYPALIEEFRFYTPHITCFYLENGTIIAQFPSEEIVTLRLTDIQPTQFYVDEDKLAAVGTFLTRGEDIIIQAGKWGSRWLSLDGHTRLYYAVTRGWQTVRAVVTNYDTWAEDFAKEAMSRNVHSPYDLELVSHPEYEIKWNRFCNQFFAEKD